MVAVGVVADQLGDYISSIGLVRSLDSRTLTRCVAMDLISTAGADPFYMYILAIAKQVGELLLAPASLSALMVPLIQAHFEFLLFSS